MAGELRSALGRALSDLSDALQVLLGTGTQPASCQLVDELLGRSARERHEPREDRARGRTPPAPSPRRSPARRHLALVR